MKKILILVLFFLSIPQVVNASEYYVATNGNDTNPGTQSSPWLTIQKAADTMIAGDTVIVTVGDYSTQRVSVTKSGSTGSPITFQSQGTVTMKGFTIKANYIIIRGFEVAGAFTAELWQADGIGINVTGNSNIIDGNYVHDCSGGGVNIGSTSDSNIVRNNRAYHNGQWGIQVAGTNHLIEGNEIWRSIQYFPGVNSPSWVDADGMRFFGSGHIFRKNYIHDFIYDGTSVINAHIDCWQTWSNNSPVTHDILIEGNTCVIPVASAADSIAKGTAVTIEGDNQSNAQAYNIIIRNNILDSLGGFYLHNTNNLQVVQNVVIGRLDQIGITRGTALHIENSTNMTVKNNIFYNANKMGTKNTSYIEKDISSDTGLDVGYNLVYVENGTPPGSSYPHDLFGVNPLFLAAPGPDYLPGVTNLHLSPTSPAINAGVDLSSLGVTHDFDNNIRPQGAGYDIGAYEFTSYCSPLGNIDCSGTVSVLDLSTLISKFGTNDVLVDLDDSGIVNILDLSILLSNFGK